MLKHHVKVPCKVCRVDTYCDAQTGLCHSCGRDAEWQEVHDGERHGEPGRADENCPICWQNEAIK